MSRQSDGKLGQDYACPACGEKLLKGIPLEGLVWVRDERSWYHKNCDEYKARAKALAETNYQRDHPTPPAAASTGRGEPPAGQVASPPGQAPPNAHADPVTKRYFKVAKTVFSRDGGLWVFAVTDEVEGDIALETYLHTLASRVRTVAYDEERRDRTSA